MCLAHVKPSGVDHALAAIRPGSDIDLRGTAITPDLLSKLLQALTSNDEEYARPKLGNARFNGVQFSGDADFGGAQFNGHAVFAGAQFNGNAAFDVAEFGGLADFERTQFNGHAGFSAQFNGNANFFWTRFDNAARFEGAQFSGIAGFNGAQFSGITGFSLAQFTGHVGFDRAQFGMGVGFDKVQFGGDANFSQAQFSSNAVFRGVQFNGDATFDWARFENLFGPLVCRGRFSARGIMVAKAARLHVAATEVILIGARFTAPTVLSVRYGAVDLTDATVDGPITIASHPSPFTIWDGSAMGEASLSGDARAKLSSLARVDAANVVLADVDLSRCVFSGAHHLDQIRIEGHCRFAAVPQGWQRGRTRMPVRWTRRKVLAEEAAWRADPARPTPARAGWSNPGGKDEPVPAPSPAQLAVLYRQLRKALEDGKDTPGAADFYYGEMEARRHDTDGTPRGERALLHTYWLLSGYALRASRALGFLAATATATFLLMLTLGLPDNQLDPQITGTQPAPGGRVALTQSTPDPALTLPLARRFTADRTDKAALVVVNSVIFRSTGATLTGPGTWIEIISRIGEPVLLGFAAVAARGRVQR